MRDNLSVILAVIMGVIVIVFIPVITILQYQNNVAYNLALSLTTEFVESIKQNGKISIEDYEIFLEKLKTTSNSFNVELQAHRYKMVKGTDESGNLVVEELLKQGDADGDGIVAEGELVSYKSSIEYTEETLIDFTEDIYNTFYQDTDIDGKIDRTYYFKTNDEIYVNVYNTNITMLDRFISSVFGTQIVNPKKVNISLGGKIFGTTQTSFVQTDFANAYSPHVVISRHAEVEGENKVWKEVGSIGQIQSGTYYQAHLPTIGSEMKFDVKVYNADTLFRDPNYKIRTKITDEDGNDIDVLNNNLFASNSDINKKISKFIQTNGFSADNIKIENPKYDNGKNVFEFTISLSGIYLSTYDKNALFSITILYGFVAGTGGALSASSTSEKFMISVPFDDGPPTLQLINIPSKFVEGDRMWFNVIATDISGVAEFKMYSGDPESDEIKDRIKISGFDCDTYTCLPDGNNCYHIYFYNIREIAEEDGGKSGDNRIKILPEKCTDLLGNAMSSEGKEFVLPDFAKDEVAPWIENVVFTVNGSTEYNGIKPGDKLDITFNVCDDSNVVHENDPQADITHIIEFIDENDNVITFLNKNNVEMDLKVLGAGYTGHMEERYTKVSASISNFPKINSKSVKMRVKEGSYKDMSGKVNAEYVFGEIIYIPPFEINRQNVNREEDGSVKIELEMSNEIANLSELNQIITLSDGLSADSIVININETNKRIIEIKLSGTGGANVILKKNSLVDIYGQRLPNEDVLIDISNILDFIH